MLLFMHTDDFDAAGTDDEILDEFDTHVNTFWTLVRTDVNYMLGQERVRNAYLFTTTRDDSSA